MLILNRIRLEGCSAVLECLSGSFEMVFIYHVRISWILLRNAMAASAVKKIYNMDLTILGYCNIPSFYFNKSQWIPASVNNFFSGQHLIEEVGLNQQVLVSFHSYWLSSLLHISSSKTLVCPLCLCMTCHGCLWMERWRIYFLHYQHYSNFLDVSHIFGYSWGFVAESRNL
jgi:hypothetical protein